MKVQQGFTLIELAIVLVIVTILVGGLAMPLSAQIQARRIAETRKAMQAIHDTLIGYALSHTVTVTVDGVNTTRHYLPCPDTNNDGLEEPRTSGTCPTVRGGLPWITLGVQGDDAWGNRYTYAVSTSFSNDGGFISTPMGSATPANLNIFSSASCAAPAVMASIPAVWVSHGPEGRGALNMNGGTPLTPTSVAPDERQNLNVASGSPTCANTSFVSHNPTDDFDDLVMWLSRNELFNRVCPSGGCP